MTPPSTSRRPGLWTAVALVGALACGAGIAVQSRINGELAIRSGDQFLAALISFGSGLVLVTLLTLARRDGRAGLAEAVRRLRTGTPVWYYLGGALGAVLVLSQALTIGLLGVALFTVAMVAGQVSTGLVVDRIAFAGLIPKALTITRITGAGLALLAALLAAVPRLGSGVPFLMLALPLVAGGLNGFQQAMNGRIRVMTSSALTATTINFVVGTVALVLAYAVHVGVSGDHHTFPRTWWVYLGGTIGVLFIGLNSVIVRHIGVLLLLMATIAGQVLTSITLDAFVFHHALPVTTLVGAAITLLGVAVAAYPAGSRSR